MKPECEWASSPPALSSRGGEGEHSNRPIGFRGSMREVSFRETLTPALSPWEGERENRRPSLGKIHPQRESNFVLKN
jgi:hypothetical protein